MKHHDREQRSEPKRKSVEPQMRLNRVRGRVLSESTKQNVINKPCQSLSVKEQINQTLRILRAFGSRERTRSSTKKNVDTNGTAKGNGPNAIIGTLNGTNSQNTRKKQTPNKKKAEKPPPRQQGTNDDAVPLSLSRARPVPINRVGSSNRLKPTKSVDGVCAKFMNEKRTLNGMVDRSSYKSSSNGTSATPHSIRYQSITERQCSISDSVYTFTLCFVFHSLCPYQVVFKCALCEFVCFWLVPIQDSSSMRIESDDEDIDISDALERCGPRKEGETTKQIGVSLNGDGLPDNGQRISSENGSRSQRICKLSRNSRAPSTRRTTKENANTNGTMTENRTNPIIETLDRNNSKPSPEMQTPNQKKAEKSIPKQQGTNDNVVPLSVSKARSALVEGEANLKANSPPSTQSSTQSTPTKSPMKRSATTASAPSPCSQNRNHIDDEVDSVEDSDHETDQKQESTEDPLQKRLYDEWISKKLKPPRELMIQYGNIRGKGTNWKQDRIMNDGGYQKFSARSKAIRGLERFIRSQYENSGNGSDWRRRGLLIKIADNDHECGVCHRHFSTYSGCTWHLNNAHPECKLHD